MANNEEAKPVMKTPHLLFISLPYPGHMNPMMQFAKRLASKNIQVTMICPSFTKTKPQAIDHDKMSINIEYIVFEGQTPRDQREIIEKVQPLVSDKVIEVVEKQKRCGDPIQVLVHDAFLSWAVDLGQQLGLRVGSFFVHGSIINGLYYLVFNGDLEVPVKEESSLSILPFSIPDMKLKDLPSHLYAALNPEIVPFLISQYTHIHKAEWIFFSTFYELEVEASKWLLSRLKYMNVGPSIPSMFLDKRIADDKNYGLNVYRTDGEACIKWLDAKDTESVVYVSFGSLMSLEQDNMHALAWGLLESKYKFLWVVNDAERNKLPNNFIEEATGKGLVVNWCPQLEVLAHKAIGSFLTHCGWNSTIESLSMGVPVLVMPYWGDQLTNAKCLVDMWKIGVRVGSPDKESITREEVAKCVKDVMEGTNREELKANAIKWREMAMKAMSEGGSSDKDINAFISQI